MTMIHPTAVVEDGADLGGDVKIGPYCTVGPHVRLGDGVHLISHVAVEGHTTIGEGSVVYPFASLGTPPQHQRYAGEPTKLILGRNNVVRETVTMNTGTVMGHGQTVVGDDGMFMAGSHVAHDCIVGNNVIFANNATIGGHVTVSDGVFLGGLCAVHQNARVGRYAFVGGMAGLEGDLIPYGSVMGNRAHLAGLNIVGMKRRNMPREQIHALRNAFRTLFLDETGTLKDRLAQVSRTFADQPEVMEIVRFLEGESRRPLCLPQSGRS